MNYKRVLKKGSSGDDVKYIQQRLISLGFSVGKDGADGKYGSNTTSAVKKFQEAYGLENDGVVGKATWTKIENVYDAILGTGKTFVRNLKKGMSGKDVRYMKDLLYNIKYLSVKPTHNVFGADTDSAVRKFQKDNKLTVDGIIGSTTWKTIVDKSKTPVVINYIDSKDYPNLSARNILSINNALSGVSAARRNIVKEILKYAYDPDKGGNCVALYVYGDNLYNTDLTLNIATASSIERAAKRNPKYFTGGRKEWMIEQVKRNPKIAASDCSGMEVGYLRKFGYVGSSFDKTANNFASNTYSSDISKGSLAPADWVWKDGHIGTYVGAGLVVEFAGGAYGCQLTKLDDRNCYNFITKKMNVMAKWTKYRKPKYY